MHWTGFISSGKKWNEGKCNSSLLTWIRLWKKKERNSANQNKYSG